MRLTNNQITKTLADGGQAFRPGCSSGNPVFYDEENQLCTKDSEGATIPFIPTDEDLEAKNWAPYCDFDSEVADGIVATAHMLRDLAGAIESAVDNPEQTQTLTLSPELAKFAGRIVRITGLFPRDFADLMTVSGSELTFTWDGSEPSSAV